MDERESGIWVKHKCGGGAVYYVCSVCENEIKPDSLDFENGRFAYCDKCGAKMEKGEVTVYDA